MWCDECKKFCNADFASDFPEQKEKKDSAEVSPQGLKRCAECVEEIHTTQDGIEIDHLPTCSKNPLTKQIDIVYHNDGDQFYIRRHDNPADPLTPITLGAVLDLHRHLRRYAEDWKKENNQLQ